MDEWPPRPMTVDDVPSDIGVSAVRAMFELFDDGDGLAKSAWHMWSRVDSCESCWIEKGITFRFSTCEHVGPTQASVDSISPFR